MLFKLSGNTAILSRQPYLPILLIPVLPPLVSDFYGHPRVRLSITNKCRNGRTLYSGAN